jgi:hypothetical protein
MMKLDEGDIIVFKTSDEDKMSVVSKVDGNLVKLFEDDGSYRQISIKDLEAMVETGRAVIESSNLVKI